MKLHSDPAPASARPAGEKPHPHPAIARVRRRGWLGAITLAAALLGSPAPARSQPSAVGAWSAPQPWIYPAIHASLLPTGQ